MEKHAYIQSYCEVAARGFSILASQSGLIEETANLLSDCFKSGRKVLLCGNGGSAGDAQHIAAELIGRFKKERRALPAIALTTDTSAITAIANDYSFDEVFARQVEAHGCEGDILIAISTSGNSANVVRACEAARAHGLSVVTMTGQSGGQLGPMGDLAIQVPSDETSHVQEMHIAVGHMVCALVESSL